MLIRSVWPVAPKCLTQSTRLSRKAAQRRREVLAFDLEAMIDKAIEVLVTTTKRQMATKNDSMWQPGTDTMEDVNRSTKRFMAFCFQGLCGNYHWYAKRLYRSVSCGCGDSRVKKGPAKAKDASTPIRPHPNTSPGQQEGKNGNVISMQPRQFGSIVIASFKIITAACSDTPANPQLDTSTSYLDIHTANPNVSGNAHVRKFKRCERDWQGRSRLAYEGPLASRAIPGTERFEPLLLAESDWRQVISH